MDEPPQLSVTADLASEGVKYHDLAGPDCLECSGVTVVQGIEVLRDRIGLTRGPSVPAGRLHRRGEIRKPGHVIPRSIADRRSGAESIAQSDAPDSWRTLHDVGGRRELGLSPFSDHALTKDNRLHPCAKSAGVRCAVVTF